MDSDPVIRYGGAYGIGLAYCGTGNNKAIQQLLHIAVSDVNDDVRRAAVTNLGFIMIRNQEQVLIIIYYSLYSFLFFPLFFSLYFLFFSIIFSFCFSSFSFYILYINSYPISLVYSLKVTMLMFVMVLVLP